MAFRWPATRRPWRLLRRDISRRRRCRSMYPIECLSSKGKKETRSVRFEQDEGPRADTSLDALSKLKAAFHAQGTVTAGNSSQMSDGAAAAIVTSKVKLPNEVGRCLGVLSRMRLLE